MESLAKTITLAVWKDDENMRLYEKQVKVVYFPEKFSARLFSDGVREHYEQMIGLLIKNVVVAEKVRELDEKDRQVESLGRRFKIGFDKVKRLLAGENVDVGMPEYVKFRSYAKVKNFVRQAVAPTIVYSGRLEGKNFLDILKETQQEIADGLFAAWEADKLGEITRPQTSEEFLWRYWNLLSATE